MTPIILHIGMHKTGTTSLQHALRAGRIALNRAGVAVIVNPAKLRPNNPGRHDPAGFAERVNTLVDKGAGRVVISAEGMSATSAERLCELVELLGPGRVTLMVTVRHWAGWLPSRWAQNSLRRDAQDFDAFLDRSRSEAGHYSGARYGLLLERMLAARPAGLRVVSYDNAVAGPGLLPALARGLALPKALRPEMLQDIPQRRGARPWKITGTLRLFNGLLAEMLGLPPDDMFDAAVAIRRPDTAFDLLRPVHAWLAQEPAMARALQALHVSARATTVLRPGDPDFTRWQRELETLARPYLVNPQKGRIFAPAAAHRVIHSAARAENLDPHLARAMRAALKSWLDRGDILKDFDPRAATQ